MSQPRIARIGLAVELTDGSKVFLVSNQVAGHIEIETKTDYQDIGYPLHDRLITSRTTDIHITDLTGYTLIRNFADTTKQLDTVQAAIEEITK